MFISRRMPASTIPEALKLTKMCRSPVSWRHCLLLLRQRTFQINFDFYTGGTRASETPYLKLPVMEMDMRRNEITAVSIDYNTSEGIWEIKIFIRGEWITIHRLDIF